MFDEANKAKGANGANEADEASSDDKLSQAFSFLKKKGKDVDLTRASTVE